MEKNKLSFEDDFEQNRNSMNLWGLITFVLFLITSFCPNYLLATPTDDFVITVKTDNSGTSADTEFAIPTYSGETYNYSVDLDNDGTPEYAGITGNTTCVFTTDGTYTIRIQGDFPRIYFNNGGDKLKVISIDQWGTQMWTSMNMAFAGCRNLLGNASDVPDLSGVTDMSYMFGDADLFNQDLSSWNTSNVVNMSAMFYIADTFNQNISTWNTSSVTNMNYMFYEALAFNQDISSWNTSNVTKMNAMFMGAIEFNQNIGGWNTGNVTTMENLFQGAMKFNQNIGNWNTGKVTIMGWMFRNAKAFNQDISNWNTGAVTDMGRMFDNATAFNQNIGTWDVTNVTGMENMFLDVTLSTLNYDSLLIGWEVQTLKNNVIFDVGNSKYSSSEAQTARANIISNYNWSINDGGYIAPTATPTITLTPIVTVTSTITVTSTYTPTATISPTSTITPTNTNTSTVTASPEKISTFGQQVLAYPNPSRDKVSFAFQDLNVDSVEINIYSLSGDRIARIEETNPGQSVTWDTLGIAPGIYLAQVVISNNGIEKKMETKKIAIIR